jgi:hypothetical protein
MATIKNGHENSFSARNSNLCARSVPELGLSVPYTSGAIIIN